MAGDAVTPIIPIETAPVAVIVPIQTVLTVHPVTVELLRALYASVPDPERIRVLVATMTPGDIAGVILAIADAPKALSALVAQLTAGQISGVVVALADRPEALKALIQSLEPGALAASVAASGNVEALRVLVATMTPEESARASCALIASGSALRLFVAQLSTDKLLKMEVALFSADVAAWEKFTDLLSDAPAKKFGGTWLDSAREELRRIIAREGYSPDALTEATAIMARARQPVFQVDLAKLQERLKAAQ